MKGLQNLFNLFYPDVCVCCDQYLVDQEKIVCIECRLDLPFIDNSDVTSNPLIQTLEGRVFFEKFIWKLFKTCQSRILVSSKITVQDCSLRRMKCEMAVILRIDTSVIGSHNSAKALQST